MKNTLDANRGNHNEAEPIIRPKDYWGRKSISILDTYFGHRHNIGHIHTYQL